LRNVNKVKISGKEDTLLAENLTFHRESWIPFDKKLNFFFYSVIIKKINLFHLKIPNLLALKMIKNYVTEESIFLFPSTLQDYSCFEQTAGKQHYSAE